MKEYKGSEMFPSTDVWLPVTLSLTVLLLVVVALTPVSAWSHPGTGAGSQYAADADAVNEMIRKEYTLHADGAVDYRLCLRTRILTYRGKKQHGDLHIPYNSAYETVEVDVAHTGTLRADGIFVQIRQDEINDIQDPATAAASLYSSARLKVINFPSVEPGTTVVADVTVHTRRPGIMAFWKREFFALSSPTTEKSVILHAPQSVSVHYVANSRIIKETKGIKDGIVTWTWTGKYLPAVVDEPLSPPDVHVSPVLFVTTLSSFKEVAAFYNALVPWQTHGILADQIPDALAAVSDIDQLYIRFMLMFMPYSIPFLNTSLNCQQPAVTVERGYGTPLQLAWLFQSILASKGISASIYAVSDSYMVSMLPLPFMPDIFSDFLVRVGNTWYSFANRELTPGITGLDSHAAVNFLDGSITSVRDRVENLKITTVNAEYSLGGSTSGIHFSMDAGESAALTRRGFRYLSGTELSIARSMVLHTVDPLAVGRVRFCGLNDLMQPVGIMVDFTIPEPVPVVYTSSFFPVPASSVLDGYIKISPDRKNPVWFPERRRDVMVFVLKLPLGVEVKGMPRDFKGSVGPFAWHISANLYGRTVYYVRQIETERGILSVGRPLKKFVSVFSRLASPAQGVVMFAPYGTFNLGGSNP